MLTQEEKVELSFFANKVADVHGLEHSEYIRVSEILVDIENKDLEKDDFVELQKLTNNFVIPEGACKAETRLLSLLKKLDEK